jgi:TfoX/Sxy family transcriptional regulator of competence genes
MAYDLKTAERVRRILSSRSDVVEKRMVGGLSFVVGGNMCCGVTGSAFMVRVGAEERDRVLAEPHVRPMKFAGRPLAGFVLVDPDGFRTDAALAAWVQQGLDFAAALPAKRPATSRRRLSTPRENKGHGER